MLVATHGSLDETAVRTTAGWRRPKLGSWYTTADPPWEEPPAEWHPRAQDITYYGDIAEAANFGQLMYVTGLQRGADQATELIFVADGAPWIWNLVTEHFPQAVQIVDWYHAAEHIWKVAHAIYGEGTDTTQDWAQQRLTELWTGQFTQLLAALQALVNPDQDDDPARKARPISRTTASACAIPSSEPKAIRSAAGPSRAAASALSAPA